MPAPKRAGCERVEEQRHARQLAEFGRGLVAELQQAERRDQREQGAIGDRARVVDRARFAAEGEGQGLGLVGAREVVGRVPGQHEHQHQQQGERQARGQGRIDPGRQQLDEGCAEPIGQQGAVSRQPRDGGRQPGRAPLRDVRHVAEGGDVGALPRIAPEQPRQHVGRAEQQQHEARQALRGTLCDEGGIR